MYEQYLRDPQSVGDDWATLFDNGRAADLPVTPTSREEVLRDEGRGTGDESVVVAPVATRPPSPVPRPQGLTPITGSGARLIQNMTDSLSVPTATSFRDITVDVLDAHRRLLNEIGRASCRERV